MRNEAIHHSHTWCQSDPDMFGACLRYSGMAFLSSFPELLCLSSPRRVPDDVATFEACEWLGVVEGVTTFEDALLRLRFFTRSHTSLPCAGEERPGGSCKKLIVCNATTTHVIFLF